MADFHFVCCKKQLFSSIGVINLNVCEMSAI